MVKNLPALLETWVWSLGQEDPLEEGMATHSSILSWRILWTEGPNRWQSMQLQRIGHDWATNTSLSLQGVTIIHIIKLCFLNGTSERQIRLNTKTWVREVHAGETVLCGNRSGLIFWSGRKKWVACNYRFSLPLASASSSIVKFVTCFEQILFFFFLPNHSLCWQEAN